MSSTNKTTHYELPQFVENDIFNPMADDNDAYEKIDTALFNIANAEADNAAAIVGIDNRIAASETAIEALQTQNGDTPLATINQTLSGAINELKVAGDVMDGNLEVMDDIINNPTTGVKVKTEAMETLCGTDPLTTTAQTLTGAVNELKSDATALGTRVTNNTTAIGGLQSNVASIQNEVAALIKSVEPLEYDIIVAADGSGDYTSLAAAVTAANDGDRIYVKAGTYNNESVEAQSKTLVIIGDEISKPVITNNYDDYSRAPIEIASGYVKNIMFISSGTGGTNHSYGAHVDYETMAGRTLVFDNCEFESHTTYALGCGTRNHGKLILKDCQLIGSSGSYGALFIHSSTNSADYGSDQQAYFINTRFYCTSPNVIALQTYGDNLNNLYLTFIGCMLNTTYASATNYIHKVYTSGAAGEVIIMCGAGNSYGMLNGREWVTGISTIGSYSGTKAIKRAIIKGTVPAAVDTNFALPTDCEEVLEFHVLLKDTSSTIWYPAGTKAHGSANEHEAFYVNEGTNKSAVVYSTVGGNYTAVIVYVSSDTTDL